MPVRWLVDPETNAILWGGLSEMPLRLIDRAGAFVADLGGGNGNFASPLRVKEARVITLDPDLSSLRDAAPGIRPVAGSLLALPFRGSSVDAITGRAVLHHVPEDLDAALAEACRVVRPGSLVLFQEPTAGNRIANAARRRFPTERHDPHERPLALEAYVDACRRHFDVLETRPFFLFSYLLPHIVGRFPPNRRRFGRRLARVAFAWDERLLAALPGLHARAAYVSILARRRPDARSGNPLIRVPS